MAIVKTSSTTNKTLRFTFRQIIEALAAVDAVPLPDMEEAGDKITLKHVKITPADPDATPPVEELSTLIYTFPASVLDAEGYEIVLADEE